MTEGPAESVDVAVITALPEEAAAVTAALGTTTERDWHGMALRHGDVSGHDVLVVPLGGMGNVRAAQRAQQIADVFNPDVLLLVGIAGGIPAGADDLRLGDVLVPDQVVGYELAKVGPEATERRWDVYRPDATLLDTARELPPTSWVHAVSTPRPDGRMIPRAHFGPVLSGEKVLADGVAVHCLRLSWPKAIGVEMESLGVALAAYRNPPRFLMVKSVSDFADAAKADDWRHYAAETAARFALEVIRRTPASRTGRREQAVRRSAPTRFPGRAKLYVCRKLGPDWTDLAVLFDVPPHHRARFERGDEARALWEWLEVRGKLPALPAALEDELIDRPDLAAYMRENSR